MSEELRRYPRIFYVVELAKENEELRREVETLQAVIQSLEALLITEE